MIGNTQTHTNQRPRKPSSNLLCAYHSAQSKPLKTLKRPCSWFAVTVNDDAGIGGITAWPATSPPGCLSRWICSSESITVLRFIHSIAEIRRNAIDKEEPWVRGRPVAGSHGGREWRCRP